MSMHLNKLIIFPSQENISKKKDQCFIGKAEESCESLRQRKVLLEGKLIKKF